MDTLFEIVKWGVLLVVGFTVLASTVRIVGQQDALVIETLGRYSKTLYAGLNFTIPLIQVAAANVSLQIRQINTRVDLKTKDNMFVAMPFTSCATPMSHSRPGCSLSCVQSAPP